MLHFCYISVTFLLLFRYIIVTFLLRFCYAKQRTPARRRRYYHIRTRSERSEHRNSAAARPHLIKGLGIRYIERLLVFGGRAWQAARSGAMEPPQWSTLRRSLRLRSLRRGCPKDEGCRRRGGAGGGGAARVRNCDGGTAPRRVFVRVLGVFSMISGIAGKF